MNGKLWHTISLGRNQINLDIVLSCGQSFRWKKTKDGCWLGLIAGEPYLLKQNEDDIQFQVLLKEKPSNMLEDVSTTFVESRSMPRKWDSITDAAGTTMKQSMNSVVDPNSDSQVYVNGEHHCAKKILKLSDSEAIGTENSLSKYLHEIELYFQLDVDLADLYDTWSKADSNFNNVCGIFKGIRILRQDPVENLFSFICSQNNNISRITSLVDKLCSTFGVKIGEFDGESLYSFPAVDNLAEKSVEEKLRGLGFGYRAKFISQSAKYILEHHSEEWLMNLRKVPYAEAHSELCKLPGVGAKVADCVCLMSLDKTEAVPVDTHVWQIASKSYLPHLRKYKSVTEKVYAEIGDHFRSLFGKYAGWAHSVLFSADLKRFKDLQQSATDASHLTKDQTPQRKRASVISQSKNRQKRKQEKS